MPITLPKPRPEDAAHTPRLAMPKTVLMCPPEFFTVSYRINPWMFPGNPTDTSRALRQWQELVAVYRDLGFVVHLIDPVLGLPDMVYSANGALTIDGVAYGVKFRHDERAPEAAHYLSWLKDHGFQTVEAHALNEGEGDFLPVGSRILAAHGFRSDLESHRELETVFSREVVSLRLVRPDFYHLDTALAVLDEDTIAYLPSAFDDSSREVLERLYPDAIIAGEDDAAWLGLNLFSDGKNVVMAKQATSLASSIEKQGFRVFPVDVSELLLGGGGVKCCTLELRSS